MANGTSKARHLTAAKAQPGSRLAPELLLKMHDLMVKSIIGSGTVSNEDRSRGSSCLAGQRMIEKIDTGEIKTPFLKFSDRVRIEMFRDGVSLFGAIDQTVSHHQP